MKLKVGYERIEGFSNPVKKAERTIDWAWIGLIVTLVVTAIISISKLS